MRRFLVFLAITVLSTDALALTPGQELLLFGVKKITYTPPTLTSNLLLALGDSRTANGGQSNYASPSFNVTWLFSNGFAGWIPALGGGNLTVNDWNYGVGAQTTAGIAGRVSIVGNDCNNYGSTTAACFTGTRGTNSGSIAVGATSFTFALVGGSAPVAGEYISWPGASGNYGCTIASVSGAGPYTINVAPPPGGVRVAADCVTSTIGTGQTFAFSPPANSSAFVSATPPYPFLGSPGLGATYSDVDKSFQTQGQYSPVTDPAQVVYLVAGTNDANMDTGTTMQSLPNLASMLDALGPSGANKIVILGDEIPRGLGNSYSVANTAQNGAPEVITAAATNTLTQAAAYYDTLEVFYAPAGTGTVPFVAGASDGTQLTNCTTGTAAAPNGTATCTPGAGQYSVTSGGVLSFNAADVGRQVAVHYRYTASAVSAGFSFLKIIHDWIDSSAADFQDCAVNQTSCAGALTDYHIPGAQYKRPWVHVAPTWAAALDPATPACTTASCNVNFYPAAYTMGGSGGSTPDGLHPQPAGGALIANALVTTAKAAGAYLNTTPFPSPTVNNPIATSVSWATTGTVAYGSGSCAADSHYTTAKANWATAMTPNTNTGVYGAGGTLATPALVFDNTSHVANGTHIVCVDTVNNALLLDAAATSSGASTNVMFQLDPTSLAGNGVFSHLNGQIVTTAVTGCGAANVNCPAPVVSGLTFTAGLPLGYLVALDAGSQTAVAAGTLAVRFGIATTPFAGDNTDWFVFQLAGFAGTSATPSISLGATTNAMVKASEVIGDAHRASCDVKIGPGPNGRLTGITGPQVKSNDSQSAFTPPGTSVSTYTVWGAQAGGGAMDFADGSLASGAPGVSGGLLSLKHITPISKWSTSSSTLTSTLLSLVVSAGKGDPISATIYFGHCWLGKVAS